MSAGYAAVILADFAIGMVEDLSELPFLLFD